jgi:hypothetical protein
MIAGRVRIALPARAPHCALMLAARITLPHFGASSVMTFLKSAGEPPFAVVPDSAKRSFILGSANTNVRGGPLWTHRRTAPLSCPHSCRRESGHGWPAIELIRPGALRHACSSPQRIRRSEAQSSQKLPFFPEAVHPQLSDDDTGEPLSGTRSLRQLVVEKTSMVAAHQACLAQPPDLPDAHRLGHGRSGRCQPPPTRIPACSANTIIVDGISDSAPAAELHLGRRTARTFPLLPPPQKN